MMQGPIPRDFVQPPLDCFQFALVYISFVELVVLSLPERWQDQILRALFCAKRSFPEGG